MNEEVRMPVREAIMQLDDRARQCILLYYGRSMNLTEIQMCLDLPSDFSNIVTGPAKLKNQLRTIAEQQGFTTGVWCLGKDFIHRFQQQWPHGVNSSNFKQSVNTNTAGFKKKSVI